MTYVVIDNKEYIAEITGLYTDREWDDRETKTINTTMTFALADSLFKDGVAWKIKVVGQTENEEGEIIDTVDEYDNSEFSVRGDLTVHTDGTVSIKMGKPTELEVAYELLYGGVK